MKYDLIIIGSGPAGYVAAIRAGQLGLKTALIEKKELGGMCINWGCVPTKAIIESAKLYERTKNAAKMGIDGIDNKNLSFNWSKACERAVKIGGKISENIKYLIKKHAVDVITGEATITTQTSVTVNNRNIETKNIIIATGSYPQKIETDVDEKIIVHLDKLFDFSKLPSNIVVFGLGPIALEMVQLLKLIDKNVTFVATKKHLIPGADKFLSDYITKKMKSEKIQIIYSDKISRSDKKGEIRVNDTSIKCDMVLNCSWRGAVLPASDIKFKINEGYLTTNLFLQTNYPNIYAVGDVNGESYFAHSASAQGLFAVNNIKGIKEKIKLQTYPINIYTYPEIAQIGKTEQEIIDMEYEYKVTLFPLSSNAKALAEDAGEGLIRILSEKKFGEVLGVQIIASNATDLISEALAFMSVEATVFDVAQTIHAHPTVSEVFMEAGFLAANNS